MSGNQTENCTEFLRSIGESFFTLFVICLSLSDDANKIKTEYCAGITVSVISENFSPIHRMASKKFSSKNSKFYRECMAH